jgi:hypothetical protein
MKKNTISICLLLFTIAQLFAQKKGQIENNKIVSDIKIKLADINSELPKNVFFTLEEYGLKPNSLKNFGGVRASTMTTVSGAMKEFNNKKLKSYHITITNPLFSKTYYGKIMFFNVLKQNENDPVARYREISIEDSYFTNATNGKVAITYEYAVLKGGFGLTFNIPTWVIMLSDVPFK